MKISGIIITKDEEKNIRDCLESVSWLDEILVIDSGSTDRTAEIAAALKAKVHKVDTNNFSEKRKLSLSLASNDWILFIDADERVTEELKEEIRSLPEDPPVSAYRINRRNYYLGKWIRHCGIFPDRHVRLFRRSKASVTERVIHEGVEAEGNTGLLKNDMLHFTCNDLEKMLFKANQFSTLAALEFLSKGKRISKPGVFLHAMSEFIRVYVSRRGFRDGIEGFYVSLNYCIVNFLTHLKLLKLQKKI